MAHKQKLLAAASAAEALPCGGAAGAAGAIVLLCCGAAGVVDAAVRWAVALLARRCCCAVMLWCGWCGRCGRALSCGLQRGVSASATYLAQAWGTSLCAGARCAAQASVVVGVGQGLDGAGAIAIAADTILRSVRAADACGNAACAACRVCKVHLRGCWFGA